MLVLSEVHQDLRSHVVGNHRDPVLRLEHAGEGVGGVQRVVKERVIGGGKLDQQDGGDRGLGLAEVGNFLGNAVFHHTKVVGLQSGDEVAVLGGDHHVKVDQGHVHSHGIVGHA